MVLTRFSALRIDIIHRDHLAARAMRALVLLLLATGITSARVPNPAIEGPVTGGLGAPFVAATTFDLARGRLRRGGVLRLRHGDAPTRTRAPLAADGAVDGRRRGATAAYKTRILVYRPIESGGSSTAPSSSSG